MNREGAKDAKKKIAAPEFKTNLIHTARIYIENSGV
jgi:hypothetical protein